MEASPGINRRRHGLPVSAGREGEGGAGQVWATVYSQVLLRSGDARQDERGDLTRSGSESHHEHGCARVILELRHLRRYLRAGFVDHIGVVQVDDTDQHHLGNLDGISARGRCRGARPVGEPDGIARDGDIHAADQGDTRCGRRSGNRLAEPVALLARVLTGRPVAIGRAREMMTAPTGAAR